jgi:DNA-binding MarR family transcriptional regulator
MEKSLNKEQFSACLYYTTGALSRILTKMANESFASTGLTASYAFIVLMVNDHPGIQPSQIGEVLRLRESTITRLLDKLEGKWLIQRSNLGKSVRVHPTQDGLDMDKHIRQAWFDLYKKYTTLIGEEETATLISAQSKAVAKFD